MKNKKLTVIGGLLALLLLLASVVTACACGSKANPMEDISPDDKKTEEPEVKMRDPSSGPIQPGTMNIKGVGQFSLSDIPGAPQEPPLEIGTVQKVTSTTLDIEVMTGGGAFVGGGPTAGPSTETKTMQIIFTSETKVYNMVIRPGVQPPMELHETSVNEGISVGKTIFVWGEESGSNRILATVIIIAAGQ